jgi:hypothetical protein
MRISEVFSMGGSSGYDSGYSSCGGCGGSWRYRNGYNYGGFTGFSNTYNGFEDNNTETRQGLLGTGLVI